MVSTRKRRRASSTENVAISTGAINVVEESLPESRSNSSTIPTSAEDISSSLQLRDTDSSVNSAVTNLTSPRDYALAKLSLLLQRHSTSLGIDQTAVSHIAKQIEASLYDIHREDLTNQPYKTDARRLYLRLLKDDGVRTRLLRGDIRPEAFAAMKEDEFLTDEQRQRDEQIRQQNLREIIREPTLPESILAIKQTSSFAATKWGVSESAAAVDQFESEPSDDLKPSDDLQSSEASINSNIAEQEDDLAEVFSKGESKPLRNTTPTSRPTHSIFSSMRQKAGFGGSHAKHALTAVNKENDGSDQDDLDAVLLGPQNN